MVAILMKPVRDNCGQWHQVGEPVVAVSIVKRAEFDARLLVNVVFENGTHGALFSDEIEPGSQFTGCNSIGGRLEA
jgi:hypothetical protein